MSASDSVADEKTAVLKRMLNHDAKAQLVNISGFCQEIERIALELKACQSDSGVSEKLDALLNDDLLPCVAFLTLSAEKLDAIHRDVVELSVQAMK